MAIYKSKFRGIEIDNGVELALSIVPNEVGAFFDEQLNTIKIGEKTYFIKEATLVQANTQEMGEQELETIEIDGTVYEIPQPTKIVANAEGDYTANLTTLKIGDNIYLIPTYSTVSANDAEDPVNILNNITINGTEYALSQLAVVGNPTADGTDNLTKIQIGDTVYTILQPHTILVNDDPLISTPTEELYAIEIDGTCYSIPQPIEVEANPTETSTTDLASLRVGEETYNIPQPTNVVANPTTEGTTDLTKLTVGDTTYNIPSGGGGGDGGSGLKLYHHEVTLSGTTTSEIHFISFSNTPVVVSGRDDFDGFIFRVTFPQPSLICSFNARDEKVAYYASPFGTFDTGGVRFYYFNLYNHAFETVDVTDVNQFVSDTVTEITI